MLPNDDHVHKTTLLPCALNGATDMHIKHVDKKYNHRRPERARTSALAGLVSQLWLNALALGSLSLVFSNNNK